MVNKIMIMASGLFGYFTFELDLSNNLSGGYLNKHTLNLQTEKGTRVSAVSPIPFVGTFNCQWTDSSLKHATLTISATGLIYLLSWIVTGTGEKYEGTGVVTTPSRMDGFYELK